MDLNELARRLNALEKVDISIFQRRARVLQSIGEKSRGLGVVRTKPTRTLDF